MGRMLTSQRTELKGVRCFPSKLLAEVVGMLASENETRIPEGSYTYVKHSVVRSLCKLVVKNEFLRCSP